MKHIIIPTDFSIRSLQPVHAAMDRFEGESVRISLLHLLHMPVGIPDLFTRASSALPADAIQSEFRNACEVLKNKYASRLVQLNTVIRYGSTAPFLRNLIEGMKADAVLVCDPIGLTVPTKISVDMVPLLSKLEGRVIRANRGTTVRVGEMSLSELLTEPAFVYTN